jgi:hypothetical protein
MLERLTLAITLLVVCCLSLHALTGSPARAITSINSSVQTPAQESKPFDQQQQLQELRKQIAGQENRPAEEVFKNIQLLKGMPTGRLLRVMEIGYSKSLGVNCTHCHVAGQWEKEEKPTKQISREMSAMVRAINNDLLKKVKNLKSETPTVNCTTCHRGQVKPALDLP